VTGKRVLAVDPGRYTYADGPWRRWFKGTAAHNTVTVDGADQTPYRKGRPKGLTSQARLLGRVAAGPGGDVDVVVGTVASPSYDARHTRRLAHCAGDYWVVHDELRAGDVHRYELRWHLMHGEGSEVTLERLDGMTIVRSPWATYAVAGADDIAITAGWVSPTYGVKHAAAVVVASVHTADADLVTVVVPGNDARVDRLAVVPGRFELELAFEPDDPRQPVIDTMTWTAASDDDPIGEWSWHRDRAAVEQGRAGRAEQ
jgi:Heparinase II/III-like protein